MAERHLAQVAGNAPADQQRAVFALVFGALIWGLIWFPYRMLRDAGIDGVMATISTYSTAFLLGLFFFRKRPLRVRFSWPLLWLAFAAGGCNLGYVLATLEGEIVRVLLLFYLAPLWTVLLSRLILGERLNRIGAAVVATSLAGAVVILWQPQIGLPLPEHGADWLGLYAGFMFALFNVLSRRVQSIAIEAKTMVAFLGVVGTGVVLMLLGYGTPRLPDAPALWALLAALGAVLIVANLVVQFGLSRVASNRAIVIMLSEVGFAAVSSWLLADEALGLREWIGGAMILAAGLCSARMEERAG